MDTGFGSKKPWSLAYSPTTAFDNNKLYQIKKSSVPRLPVDSQGMEENPKD